MTCEKRPIEHTFKLKIISYDLKFENIKIIQVQWITNQMFPITKNINKNEKFSDQNDGMNLIGCIWTDLKSKDTIKCLVLNI